MQSMANEELCRYAVIAAAIEKAQLSFDVLKLTTDILSLNECTSFDQVHGALCAISADLGFDAFLYGGQFQISGARQTEHIVTNFSPAWRQRYEQQGYLQLDPALVHARNSLCPLVWCDAMYATEEQRHFQQEARAHGLAEGVTFPVHSRNGDFALLSLSLSRSNDGAREHVRAMLKWGALLAALTHEAMARVVTSNSAAKAPKLTRREAEVLQWISVGKSNWEIARLVDISEHGVSHHVRNILLKFDVTSRHQAAAKAVALGLLRQKLDGVLAAVA